MKKILTVFFGIILVASIIPLMFSDSIAQSFIPPRHQWKITDNVDELTCSGDSILLQKHNGDPACVSPTTYLKLIDRGYGTFDSSIMKNRPVMLNNLMKNLVSTSNLMHHWHDMMLDNPTMMNQTLSSWMSKMKTNPDFLANIMRPMTSDSNLREQMIQQMKEHPYMENTLKQNPKWMESVHHMPSDMGPQMNQNMHQEMQDSSCSWCPDHNIKHNTDMRFSNPDKMMDFLHNMWVDPKLRHDMHNFMLENPSHMLNMTEQMMNPVLDNMMNDPQIRQQMIDLMLEHSEFMNSIRHQNPSYN